MKSDRANLKKIENYLKLVFACTAPFAGLPACMVRLEGVVGLNARF
ncbi:hypothetical protein DW66_0360 [Pseudomonas putida]|nr:hypothetical protein DW66_0360 [Pseudomonas putida]